MEKARLYGQGAQAVSTSSRWDQLMGSLGHIFVGSETKDLAYLGPRPAGLPGFLEKKSYGKGYRKHVW